MEFTMTDNYNIQEIHDEHHDSLHKKMAQFINKTPGARKELISLLSLMCECLLDNLHNSGFPEKSELTHNVEQPKWE